MVECGAGGSLTAPINQREIVKKEMKFKEKIEDLAGLPGIKNQLKVLRQRIDELTEHVAALETKIESLLALQQLNKPDTPPTLETK